MGGTERFDLVVAVVIALVVWATLTVLGDDCAERGGYVITGTHGEAQCSVWP